MAIMYGEVKAVQRSKGQSIIAKAAYQSAENIRDEYQGKVHRYANKKWVVHKEILLPENAPEEYRSREILWNAVEHMEKSPNALVAHSIMFALPHEMTLSQQIEVAREFAMKNFVSRGFCADICIHIPPETDDKGRPIDKYGNPTTDIEKMHFINAHVHGLVSGRPLNELGEWEEKSQAEYVCKKGEEEQVFTAEEFKEAKMEGWEKQYRFILKDKKVWLPASQAEGLERVSRAPKTTKFGRQNEKIKYMNAPERNKEWRISWQNIVNEEFKSMGSDIRIDARSYEERGVEKIPMQHLGPEATNIDRRAEREIREGKNPDEVRFSGKGMNNRDIKAINEHMAEVKKIIMLLNEIAARIMVSRYESERSRVRKYEDAKRRVEEADEKSLKQISGWRKELEAYTPLQRKKKLKVQKQIQNEFVKMQNRTDYLHRILTHCGFASEEDVRNVKDELEKQNGAFEKSKREKNAKEDVLEKTEGRKRDFPRKNAIERL